ASDIAPKVRKVPPPATALMAPPANAATNRRSASRRVIGTCLIAGNRGSRGDGGEGQAWIEIPRPHGDKSRRSVYERPTWRRNRPEPVNKHGVPPLPPGCRMA